MTRLGGLTYFPDDSLAASEPLSAVCPSRCGSTMRSSTRPTPLDNNPRVIILNATPPRRPGAAQESSMPAVPKPARKQDLVQFKLACLRAAQRMLPRGSPPEEVRMLGRDLYGWIGDGGRH